MASKAPAPGGHVVRRPHMPMSERAKIFIPFDPLPGYRQMLREREEELLNVPRVDLSGEQRERLSRQIRELEPGQLVAVTHYVDGRYVKTVGCVSRVLEADGLLCVVGEKIPIDTVAAIEDAE